MKLLTTAQKKFLNLTEFFDGTVLDDTFVERFFELLGLSGITTIMLGLLSLLGLLPFLTTPGLFFYFLNFITGLKNRKPWGFVIDKSTKTPIRLAKCVLYKSETTTVEENTFSDFGGQFGFPIVHGKYRLEITKPGFDNFVHDLQIGENEKGYVLDAYLVPAGLTHKTDKDSTFNLYKFQLFLSKLYSKLIKWVFIIGFVISVLAVLVSGGLVNIVVLSIYVFLGILYVVNTFSFVQEYASVVDSTSDLRVPNAIVKIFDLQNSELVDTKTNK